MQAHFYFVAFLFACLLQFGKPADTQKIGQPLLCHGCVAVLRELHKVLKDSSGSKKKVSRSLNNLCQLDNFASYTFSPPKMIKACNYIVDTHKKELTENLIQYYRKFKTEDNLPLQEKFCDHAIKACEGVRRPTRESEMNPSAFARQGDDEPQPVIQNKFTTESDVQPVLEEPKTPTAPTSHEEL